MNKKKRNSFMRQFKAAKAEAARFRRIFGEHGVRVAVLAYPCRITDKEQQS